MERLAQSKEDEIELKLVQLMMKDTSTMSDSQRDIHEKYCNKMKKMEYALGNHDEYFRMRVDATGKMGLSPLQKCTSAIRMLAYGSAADIVDKYGVNAIFGAKYLRKHNNTDVEHLLQMGESRGFPGRLGSIDCMHWEWKNCPVAWKGQFYRGDHGSNNDINVLNQSNVFNDILEGHAPNMQYTFNGTPYNMGYYLAYGIYPEWATFVKTISMPQGEKKKLFAQHQESARKDVERAFGVLQSRFAIIRGPGRAHPQAYHICMHHIVQHDCGRRTTYIWRSGISNNTTSPPQDSPPKPATLLRSSTNPTKPPQERHRFARCTATHFAVSDRSAPAYSHGPEQQLL
ncbi:uncharacterized protein LOC131641753 [Vicia villosa]|uniref:uncharacterized protein LOC131641753 n=1 Tax=Vicia villosa TaxID=3911 RepID=UPI00273C6D13|nr:uncharacterized protein LOC131641753 [Vicia villosa]